MCEVKKVDGTRCQRDSRYHLYVSVIPQAGHESSPAGRSVGCCNYHLTVALRSLSAIDYRTGEAIKVRMI